MPQRRLAPELLGGFQIWEVGKVFRLGWEDCPWIGRISDCLAIIERSRLIRSLVDGMPVQCRRVLVLFVVPFWPLPVICVCSPPATGRVPFLIARWRGVFLRFQVCRFLTQLAHLLQSAEIWQAPSGREQHSLPLCCESSRQLFAGCQQRRYFRSRDAGSTVSVSSRW